MAPRVLRHALDEWVDPAVAHALLIGDREDSVWLDSGRGATSGRSYLGLASRVVTTETIDGSMLEFLRDELRDTRVAAGEGFQLGWVGWLGYELRFELLGQVRNRRARHPDAAFLYLDRVVEFDHASATVTLLALGEAWTLELAGWRDATIARLRGSAALPAGVEVDARPNWDARAIWSATDGEYLAEVESCIRAITDGDAYQLCLTNEVTVAAAVDPVATYRALREASPSHHGGLLRIGGVALLSSSPEVFLTVSPTGEIESRPIKGTRRRGQNADEDAALRLELELSEKERAENLMIVDLMRNDIGRVSEVGSVSVPSLLEVESYAQVHQLVSTVRGQLLPGLVAVDAVASCFPAGSMTGAPKYSATRLLDELEQRPRGLYSGAFGYFGLDGRVDLAVVIRSIVVDVEGATIGSGGGITALSDPAFELDEVKLKAAALLASLRG
ncbi:MAG: para-aminobenzoate synthetase component [Actinomycetota bacterium]|nr:para-aminobenzoate synthetase component [Actinomycetota bacterium]